MEKHNHGQNIKIALFLNITFTIIEIIGGIWTNSLAILSDALHDFGDSVALLVAWGAEKMSQKKPDQKRTFGYKRISLFSAFLTALVLVSGSLFILSKAIPRLMKPEHVDAKGVMLLAVLGILINGIGFYKTRSGKNINEKVVSLHLLEDVLGWVVLLIGGAIISFWDNHIIDPIMTIGFTLFILRQVVKNIKEIFNILLQGVPKNIRMDNIQKELLSVGGILGVHDMHIWSLEGETNIFSGHIIVNSEALKNPDEIKMEIRKELKKYNIHHSTLELESTNYCSGIECTDL